MNSKKYTAVSLFSGAGGMDVGFEQAGIDVVLANEMDPIAAKTLAANHTKVKIVVDDVNNVFPVLEEYKDVDIVFGGPPCQGFSVIGKMDPEDIRSQLIWSFLEAIKIIQPKAFVMENVKALAYISKWRGVKDEFLNKARAMGYTCYPFIVNALEYGTPQKRERVFFVGIKGDNEFENTYISFLEKQKSRAPTIRELFKDLGPAGTDKNPKTCSAKITFAERPVIRKNPYDCLMFNGIGRPIDPDGYSRTITASQGGNMTLIVDELFLHNKNADNWIQEYYDKLISKEIVPHFAEAPSRLRRLTINETRRIQTFPDEYVFFGAKTNIYRQIGNAVPCNMACAVAKALVDLLDCYS